MQGAWVQSLVRELRSHMPMVQPKKKKREEEEVCYISTDLCLLDLATKKLIGYLGNNSFGGEKEIDIRKRL